MKRVLVTIIFVLCTSCVMEESDGFIVSGGLHEIQTREQLFERDLQLALATDGTQFDGLAAPVRTCLTTSIIERASPDLLDAADGFLARKSEAKWIAYRQAYAGDESGLDSQMIRAMTHQCAAASFQMAGR